MDFYIIQVDNPKRYNCECEPEKGVAVSLLAFHLVPQIHKWRT